MKKAIIICGPTASGKTDFAHSLAQQNNGEIVNADSMQLYKQLPIITASPSDELKAEIPYHLYNFQDIDQELSAAKYVALARKTIIDIESRGKLPIIVGGSGMYISMLVNGYSQIPNIKDEIRQDARKLHAEIGAEKFFKLLNQLDPEITKKLNEGDTQRVIRAYEVVKQTGESILIFQAKGNIKPLPDFKFEIEFLNPDRNTLYARCNARFLQLLEQGAIEEVESAYKQYGGIKTTGMNALGAPEIISYLKDEITKEKMIELASARTRQYAKRQVTWFKNQKLVY
ncbi:tRNA (adenosine(37)-N6)-dimethylallyltransferase MiaA [Rickettsiaceae bacterium]|nr:tRNA (adenosine(37)-N6)-dimethylallyltransferase MiaA [Rickettsiaceae bacterium]